MRAVGTVYSSVVKILIAELFHARKVPQVAVFRFFLLQHVSTAFRFTEKRMHACKRAKPWRINTMHFKEDMTKPTTTTTTTTEAAAVAGAFSTVFSYVTFSSCVFTYVRARVCVCVRVSYVLLVSFAAISARCYLSVGGTFRKQCVVDNFRLPLNRRLDYVRRPFFIPGHKLFLVTERMLTKFGNRHETRSWATYE